MTLNEKQAEFSLYIAQLIVWAHTVAGVKCLGSEWHRTPEQAALNAKLGKGLPNSNHIRKLALDIYICIDGAVTWDLAPYQILGDKWKSMHPLARWGGDFKTRDSVHFSFEHNGIK